MANFLHKNDLPDDLDLGNVIAVDTETQGLSLTQKSKPFITLPGLTSPSSNAIWA